MLKTVLWIAAACAAVLVALAVSRSLHFDRAPARPPEATVAPPAPPPVAPPVVETPSPAPQLAPPPAPKPTPDEQQMLDDAAATGMTTVEPERSPEPSPN